MSFLHNSHHHISLSSIDPLGGGLAEEIAAEQSEPEAITLEEFPDGVQLADQWDKVVAEVEHDPDWFHFAEDE